MSANLSDDDRGKAVVNSNQEIATITDVVDDTAYVEPDWEAVPAGVLDELDWDRGEDPNAIPASAVSGVDEDTVFLRDDLL